MTEKGQFPDVEQVLIAMLDDLGYACTVLPRTSLDPRAPIDETKMPIIWISRNGGRSDGITDRPIVEVSVLAKTRGQSWDVAGKARDRILKSAGTAPGGDLIDAAGEVTGVTPMPDFDALNRLVSMTFGLSFRRKR